MEARAADSGLEVWPVATGDLELICRHREEMFRDAGDDEATLRAMTEHFRTWLEPRLADGSYLGYTLRCDGTVAAGVGLMLIDWPPHPRHPTADKRGYILNLYVEPEYRRRGLGHQLMALAEEELARRGATLLILHATEKARPLYSQLDWVAGSAEMIKQL